MDLEILKKRYLNATDPFGKNLLKEQLINLATLEGRMDELTNWFNEVDGRIEQELRFNRELKQEIGKSAQEKESEVPEEPESIPLERLKELEEPVEKPVEEPETKEKRTKEVEEKEEEKEREVEEAEKPEAREHAKDFESIKTEIQEIGNKLKEMEDALAQHKKILEKLTEQEELVDEKEKITPQEFGIRFSENSPKDKIYDKMLNIRRKAMKKETPTERRKRRLKAQEKMPDSLSEFYHLEEDIEKMKKLPRIPETPFATKEQLEGRKEKEKEEIKKRVWDISRLAAEYKEDSNQWVITYDGQPFVKINYDEDIAGAEEFSSRSFGSQLLKDFIKDSQDEFQKKYKAEIYENVIEGAKEKDEEKEKKEEEKEKEKEAKVFELRFERAAALADLVLAKNLVKHPLKAVMFDVLRKNGIKNPVSIIEDVFRIAGREYFNTWFRLAKKYYNMDEKTLIEVEEFAKSAGNQIPYEIDALEMQREAEAMEIRRRAVEGSIPLVGQFSRTDPLKQAMPKPLNWYNLNKEV